MARMPHGFKYAERPPPNGVQRRHRAQVRIEHGRKACRTFSRRTLAPFRIREALRQHLMVNVGMLTHIDRGQMEPERAYTTQEPLHIEQSRSPSAVGGKALGDQPDVVGKLRRGLILFRQRLVGGTQALSHLPEEDAIRHPVMARRRHSLHARQTPRIFLRPCHQCSRHTNAAGTLR